MVPAPADKTLKITGYPEGLWVNYVSWSPDNRHISFTTRSPGGPGDPPRAPHELWLADPVTGRARQLLKNPEHGLNNVFERWAPGGGGGVVFEGAGR